mmetsp:Transcript_13283/g.27106  ORF Transcript_13283/g.27106 Transcript_13283/m.27106 type:complete len:230 (-) Transcript_13283:357-1046(-)
MDLFVNMMKREHRVVATLPCDGSNGGDSSSSGSSSGTGLVGSVLLAARQQAVLASSHLFTSHFYISLTTQPKKKKDGDCASSEVFQVLDSDDEDAGRCEPALKKMRCAATSAAAVEEEVEALDSEARHTRVARWTKDFDVFTTRFVFVPIVVRLHWSMAIVCYLDCLEDYLESRRRQEGGSKEESEKRGKGATSRTLRAVYGLPRLSRPGRGSGQPEGVAQARVDCQEK